MKMAITAFLTIILFAALTQAAVLRGTVYDSDFNALSKVLVEINSTPRQTMVAQHGEYAFNVPLGHYEINAFFENASTSAEASVITEGDYRIDLILISIDLGELNAYDQNLPNVLNETFAEEKTQPPALAQSENLAFFAIVALALATLVAAAWLFTRFKKRAKNESKTIARKKARREVAKIVEEKHVTLTREQRELLEKIKSSGGRLKQKDLRKQVEYSEAKVSLDLDVLESQGLIKRIKKGRGNIIIARE